MKKSKWNILGAVLWLAVGIFVLAFLLMPGEPGIYAGYETTTAQAGTMEAFIEDEEALAHPKGEEEAKAGLIAFHEDAAEADDTAEDIVSKYTSSIPVVTASADEVNAELNGVWISYLEWNELPSDEAGFYAAVNQIYDHVKAMGMNAVFVHVRPDSDAMYPSEYFPWSKFITGIQGQDPGYDPLAYLVQAAHDRGLEFHAWINPYRVTGYLMGPDDMSAGNPARQWMSDSGKSRHVLLHEGFYYYNPSVPEVRELIINGTAEIVKNYQVDGIHFDDYFYPTLNDGSSTTWFDKPDYEASGSSLGITQWRRDQVSELVAGTYRAIKEINPDVVFGISPAGFVDNLRSDSKLFVDIDLWMSQPGYIDYIMPQLYWGFEAKKSDKTAAPYAYEANLKTWIDLKHTGDVKLYIGLAMSRAGTSVADNNPVSEWLSRSDILKRQVETGRASGEVSGYCYFSYRSFLNDYAQEEVGNLLSILK